MRSPSLPSPARSPLQVLHVTSSLNPTGGGPAEGIRQFAVACGALGAVTEVATLDDAEASWNRSFPAPVHALGPGALGYKFSTRLTPWLRANAKRFDAVIVNGLWQYQAFGTWRALARSGVPYLVYPHGMLDPWFKRQYPLKHLKKWLYWPWADYRVLRDALAVLFTCEEERVLARKSFWLYATRREAVVGYGIEPPPEAAAAQRAAFLMQFPELRDKRLLLFLGRIHPKKGCDLLIEAFAGQALQDDRLRLMMAGPDQVGWGKALSDRARALGVADRIVWPGMLTGELKWGAFRSAEAFVLPSHQENFGIAVVEAMACGTPVLISDKVNIWREIKADGAGLVAPDTLEGTRQLFAIWEKLPPRLRAEMGKCATGCAAQHFRIEAACARVLDIVRAARNDTGRNPPATRLA